MNESQIIIFITQTHERIIIGSLLKCWIYSSFFWFSFQTTYNVLGTITIAPKIVFIEMASLNNSHPTPADKINSVYRKGANALASTMENDFNKQYKSAFAPAPNAANAPYCVIVGPTQPINAKGEKINVVNNAV